MSCYHESLGEYKKMEAAMGLAKWICQNHSVADGYSEIV